MSKKDNITRRSSSSGPTGRNEPTSCSVAKPRDGTHTNRQKNKVRMGHQGQPRLLGETTLLFRSKRTMKTNKRAAGYRLQATLLCLYCLLANASACSFNKAALSVRSHGKSMSVRPKWP